MVPCGPRQLAPFQGLTRGTIGVPRTPHCKPRTPCPRINHPQPTVSCQQPRHRTAPIEKTTCTHPKPPPKPPHQPIRTRPPWKIHAGPVSYEVLYLSPTYYQLPNYHSVFQPTPLIHQSCPAVVQPPSKLSYFPALANPPSAKLLKTKRDLTEDLTKRLA